VRLRANPKLTKSIFVFTGKPVSTFTKLRRTLRKAEAIAGKAKPAEKMKAQAIVSRLKRAVQAARKKHYKELGL
jgi:hypothetical protein